MESDARRQGRVWSHMKMCEIPQGVIPEDFEDRLSWYRHRRAAQRLQAALKASRVKVWRR